MTCHPEVHDAAISQFNDYENEKRTEEYIVSLQDIASPDLTGVIVDACPDGLPREGSPTLLRRARVTGVFNVAPYCAFRSAQSQLQQFTMNAVGQRFSRAMYWISLTVSSESGGRPNWFFFRDLRFHNQRYRSRCQRRSVSG